MNENSNEEGFPHRLYGVVRLCFLICVLVKQLFHLRKTIKLCIRELIFIWMCSVNLLCGSKHYCCPGLGSHFSQWFQRCLMTMNLNLLILVLLTLALVMSTHFLLFTLSPHCNLLQWPTASRSCFQSPRWPLASPKQAITTKQCNIWSLTTVPLYLNICWHRWPN